MITEQATVSPFQRQDFHGFRAIFVLYGLELTSEILTREQAEIVLGQMPIGLTEIQGRLIVKRMVGRATRLEEIWVTV